MQHCDVQSERVAVCDVVYLGLGLPTTMWQEKIVLFIAVVTRRTRWWSTRNERNKRNIRNHRNQRNQLKLRRLNRNTWKPVESPWTWKHPGQLEDCRPPIPIWITWYFLKFSINITIRMSLTYTVIQSIHFDFLIKKVKLDYNFKVSPSALFNKNRKKKEQFIRNWSNLPKCLSGCIFKLTGKKINWKSFGRNISRCNGDWFKNDRTSWYFSRFIL